MVTSSYCVYIHTSLIRINAVFYAKTSDEKKVPLYMVLVFNFFSGSFMILRKIKLGFYGLFSVYHITTEGETLMQFRK